MPYLLVVAPLYLFAAGVFVISGIDDAADAVVDVVAELSVCGGNVGPSRRVRRCPAWSLFPPRLRRCELSRTLLLERRRFAATAVGGLPAAAAGAALFEADAALLDVVASCLKEGDGTPNLVRLLATCVIACDVTSDGVLVPTPIT